MRETVRSLQVYFIVIGLLSGGLQLLGMRAPGPVAIVLAVVTVVIAAAFIYVGIRLRTLLVVAPKPVLVVVLASGVPAVLALVVSLFVGWVPEIVMAIGQLLVTWYLYVNVRRLSSGGGAVPVTS